MSQERKLIQIIDRMIIDLANPNIQLKASPKVLNNLEWINELVTTKSSTIDKQNLDKVEKIHFAEFNSIKIRIAKIIQTESIDNNSVQKQLEEVKKSINTSWYLFENRKELIGENNLKIVKSPKLSNPNKIIYIDQKANKGEIPKSKIVSQAKEFIKASEIDNTFDLLFKFSKTNKIKNSDEFDKNLMLLSSRYSKLKKENLYIGEGESSDANLTKIVNALLELIKELE